MIQVDPSVKDTLELDINPVAIEYYGYEGVYTVLTADSTFNGEAVETVRVELLKDDDDRATMLLTVNNGDVIELFCYDWDSWDNTAYYKSADGSIDVTVTDNGIDGIDIMSIDYSWAIYAKEFVNITGVTLASVTYTDDGAPVINPLKPGHLIVTATSKVDPS